MTSFTTYVPFPPTVQALPASAGTITHIHCAGPIDADIRDAAGNLLTSIKATTVAAPAGSSIQGGGPQAIADNLPYDVNVSLAFTGGAPYVVQRSTSAITLTIA